MKKIIITAIVIGTLSIGLFACGCSALDPEQGQTTNTEAWRTTSVAGSRADAVNDAASVPVETNEMTFYRAIEFKVAN